MQEREHGHSEGRASKRIPGYEPTKAVTRYELATVLFTLLTQVEAAAAQPRRTANELKPGRKSVPKPNPALVKPYTDVPAGHWALKSIQGLAQRGVSLVGDSAFRGDQPVTGNELARSVDGVAGWIEGRPAQATTLKDLAKAGFLPQTSSLITKASKSITADELSKLLVAIVARSLERISTASPDSRYGRS